MRGPAQGDSLSGHERNHLFLNRAGRDFLDVAAVSGLDSPADGRSAGAFDFDRDGWLDFAVVNANTPLLQLFHNGLGQRVAPAAERPGVLALRFRGANRTGEPAPGKSPRDGFGALVELTVGGANLLREHRAGEGFAAQSSATMLVGLGHVDSVPSLSVRWPSGTRQTHADLPAFALVTLYEDASETPDGSGMVIEPYLRDGAPPATASALTAGEAAAVAGALTAGASAAAAGALSAGEAAAGAGSSAPPAPGAQPVPTAGARLDLGDALGSSGTPALRLHVTMATWCPSCRRELPQVAQLRSAFADDELDLVGLPIDERDDAAKLADYRAELAPAYRLLAPLDAPTREAVQQLVLAELGIDALPAAILTDANGRVLATMSGAPSVSWLRGWLDRQRAGARR